MNIFICDFFVEEPIIKALNKVVETVVLKLDAAKQILAFFGTSKLNRGVDL